ncbi:unnamed protein product [Orchesella dallaii]|uniref:Heat shock 70 kDa protein 4L n=1 Tax=Orchesella dallaii TaxID=48710 RepID=A0ABP1RIX6_9HEXA
MSIIGIDFGNYSSFVAVARAGRVEAINNDHSLKATPSYVAFSEKQRILGVLAKNQAISSNLQNTIFGFKRYLARRFEEHRIQADIKRVPFTIVNAGCGYGGVGIRVNYLGRQETFSPEQLTAMLFTKLKETTEKQSKVMNVKDCVISVPSYFTDAERRALLDAAVIAGLHPLQLLNDTTAAALHYGYWKRDLPESDAPSRNVVIMDWSHSAIQVCICAFNQGKLKVLAYHSDTTLGGRELDSILLYYLLSFPPNCECKWKILNDPKRFRMGLLADAEMLKIQMSATTSELPLHANCPMGESRGEKNRISRAIFEKICASMFEGVEEVLRKCLEDSKLGLNDIHSVELLGGSSRIPVVKRIVKKVFGKPPATTVILNETVALGCALQCALLSPHAASRAGFKVSDYDIFDIQPYPINLVWKLPLSDEIAYMEIFPINHPIPSTCNVSFVCQSRKKTAFKVAYSKQDPCSCCSFTYPSKTIGKFILDLNDAYSSNSCMFNLTTSLNIHGIFSVDSATVVELIDNGVNRDKPIVYNLVGIDPPPPAGDEANEQAVALHTPSPPAGTEAMDIDTSDSSGQFSEDEHIRVIANIEVERYSIGFDASELEEMVTNEARMIAEDKKEEKRQALRNSLEEQLYDFRKKLGKEYKKFVDSEGRQELYDYLTGLENWVNQEELQEEKVVNRKLEELQEKVEEVKRREALHLINVTIKAARTFVYEYHSKTPEYAHIDESDMDKVVQYIEDCETWLTEVEVEMEESEGQLPKNAPPLSQLIKEQRYQLNKKIHPILNTPKPMSP